VLGSLLLWLVVTVSMPALLHGQPSKVLEPSVAVTGPLQLTVVWKPPVDWNTEAGRYELIVIHDETPLWVHLKNVPLEPTSFVLDVVSAATFRDEAAYPGATNVEPLKMEPGARFSVFMTASNSQGVASVAVSAPPMRLMMIGQVSAPENVHICDADDDDNADCTIDTPSLSLLLTWLKPTDTGAGTADTLPISHYEVVLAEDVRWSIGVNAFNISSSEAQGEGGICKAVVPNLPKGTAFFARVRGYNQVGPGLWGEQLFTSRVVLSPPGEPVVRFVGSGVVMIQPLHSLPAFRERSAPFLAFFWMPPLDRGGGLDTTFNITIQSYQIQVGTSADLDGNAIITTTIDRDNSTTSFFWRKCQLDSSLGQ